MKHKTYFKDKTNNKSDDEIRLFKQSKNKKWTFQNKHHKKSVYLQAVTKDIEQSKTVTPRKIRTNLSKYEKVAVKDLSKRDDIIFTNAHQGGAVVITDVKDYIAEAKSQLNDSENYKVFAKDRTTTNSGLVDQTINRFKNEQLINKNIANRLKNQSPRTTQL